MIKCLIFSGGSFKGFSYIGVMKYIEEHKLCENISCYYGTSIGAITAVLLSIGYTSTELQYCISKLDFETLVNIKNINITDLFETFGFINPLKLYHLLDLLIEKKTKIKNITFEQHFQKYQKRVVITGSNISLLECHYFDYKTQPNLKILEGLKISSCIPFIFKPITFMNHYFVDGALYDNYPILEASKYFKPNEMLGFHIIFDYNIASKVETIEDYVKHFIFSFAISINKMPFLHFEKCTIPIVHKDVSILSIEQENINDIINIGYESIKKYHVNNPKIFHSIKINLNSLDYDKLK
jgi:predicted acylesterase/phospholipase RssA